MSKIKILVTGCKGRTRWMRIPSLIVMCLFSLASAFSEEWIMTDAERTKAAKAVFVGSVMSTGLVGELETGALWRAVIKIATVDGADEAIATNAVIYYEQPFTERSDKDGIHVRTVTCGALPEIKVSQNVKLWCMRKSFGDHTNVLYVPSAAWARVQ